MATNSVQFDGIRLQAERVCRAYRTLHATAHSADFTSDEFPVGLFAELFQQLKQLDCWLEPAEAAEPLSREKGVNEAFGERVGQRIDEASLCIERARRLTEVCAASCEALDVEHSHDVAFTMNGELWGALDDARKALEGGQPS